jgi:DNA-binding IscR family transcriptional regulator
VSIITAEPGLKLSAVAERVKVKPNYLYRLLPELAKDGKVVKRDKAWFPA